jgi:hypothetical protein
MDERMRKMKYRILKEDELIQAGDVRTGNLVEHEPFSRVWYGVTVNKYHASFNNIIAERPVKPKRGKWHRVEDELPKDIRDVAIKTADGYASQAGWYSPDMDKWHKLSGTEEFRVTHWRELPKFKEPK